MRFSFEKVFFKGTPFFFVTRICEGLKTFTGIFLGGGKCAINAHIPRVNRPSRGATSLRARSNSRMSRDNQCAGIALHPMLNHPNQCAHSSRQSTLQGRNLVAHARAPIRECHATINARASRCIRCSTIRINAHIPHVNQPSKGATALRTHALQFANVTRQSMRGYRAASGTTIRINAHISRVNQPSRGATSLRTRALQGANDTRK